GGVVEQGQGTVRRQPRIVLPLEAGLRLEARVLPTQLPEDLSRPPADLVDRPGVARTDQEVAVRQLLNRVDVKEVKRAPTVRSTLGITERYVPKRVPFPQHLTRRHVDLLNNTVEHPPVTTAAQSREVPAHRYVRGYERRAAVREQELVQVCGVAITGADRSDPPVGAIKDHVLAHAVGGGQRSLKISDHRLTAVALNLHVKRLQTGSERGKPEQPSLAVKDLRSILLHGLRVEEDVP